MAAKVPLYYNHAEERSSLRIELCLWINTIYPLLQCQSSSGSIGKSIWPEFRGPMQVRILLNVFFRHNENFLVIRWVHFRLHMKKTHEQEIKAFKVTCTNSDNGCGWVGELRSLDYHLTTCGYALLCCPNKHMYMKNKKEVLCFMLQFRPTSHEQVSKLSVPVTLYCDGTRMTTTHLDVCQTIKVTCPNTGCKTLVPNLIINWSKCQFEKVPCKY